MKDSESISDGIGCAGFCLACAIAFVALAQCQMNEDTQKETTARLELQLKHDTGKAKP